MKEKKAQLAAARQQLLQQMPDLSTILPGAAWCAAINPVAASARRAHAKATGRFGFSPSVSAIARCAKSLSPSNSRKR